MFDILNNIWDWINNIPVFITSIFVQLQVWVVVFWLKIKLSAIQMAWTVAEGVLSTLGISQLLNDAWGHLDSNLLRYLTFFGIPEGLNILINAFMTKFVLRIFN